MITEMTEELQLTRMDWPTSLQEAADMSCHAGAVLFAGGCEIALGLRSGETPRRMVNLARVKELSGFEAHPKTGLRIGGLVKIREVATNLWIAKRWAALHESVEQLMPPQIHHMGTIVGNLCAGVPYHDMATALAALRAEVRIYRQGHFLSRPLRDFYLATGQADLHPGDIVVEIVAKPPVPDAGSAFRKIEKIRRDAADMPKISAASYVALDPEAKTVVDATVVIGCCGNSPIRAVQAEAALIGAPASHATYARAGRIAAGAAENLTQIDWLETLRRQLAEVLARDAIEQAASRGRSRHNPFEDAHELV